MDLRKNQKRRRRLIKNEKTYSNVTGYDSGIWTCRLWQCLGKRQHCDGNAGTVCGRYRAGNAELNKLYEKENAIIAKHQELWNTVFNNIDKNKAADAGEQNYGTFLETQLDHVKDQFSEADLKKLDKDIEEIKKIEDQVTELTAQMGTENSGAQSANAETSVFPSFQAKDLDGNKVDSSIFSQNAVTVVNFWFNGCTPCVEELPALNKLNED